jgi:anti-sigma-K factor RskA
MTSDTSIYSDYIPGYYHGTLEPELQIRFEEELENNPTLRQELDDFRKFATLYHDLDHETPQPSPQLFARITAGIDKAAEKRQTNQTGLNRLSGFSAALRNTLRRLKESYSLPWSVVALQAVVLVVLLLPATSEKSYETLSNRAVLQSQGSGETYNIVFRPETTESEIRQLLLKAKATIISGPSAQGRYIIMFTSDEQSQRQQNILKNNASILFFDKSF